MTAADPRAVLDQLEAAREKATPGPWLSGAADGAVAVTRSAAEYGSRDGSTFALLLPGPEVWNPTEAMANARLCSEMHHATPALVAAVRGVLDRADREIDHAEAGARYAAEVDQAVLLRSEEARAAAWRTVRSVVTAALASEVTA